MLLEKNENFTNSVHRREFEKNIYIYLIKTFFFVVWFHVHAPSQPLPAQAPLAGEKNKQPRNTPQGLDTKHPQSNLPISLTMTFVPATWISHTFFPPSPSRAVTVQLWTNLLNNSNQKRIQDLKKQASFNFFISFPLSITFCHSLSITVHRLDLPPCILFIFELALNVQFILFFVLSSLSSLHFSLCAGILFS